jgi:cell division protein ZapD
MSESIYEFPLNERIRNYLRIEHLIARINVAAQHKEPNLQLVFFEHLFTLLDMLERIDVRTDIVKELDNQERNLVHWAQHPNIDNQALQQTLSQVIRTRDSLKAGKKPGTELKNDSFLQSIKQRFSIPGGTCSFDLPQLHFWLHQPTDKKQTLFTQWLSHIAPLKDGIDLLLSFLREAGVFTDATANNGFYQGDSEDKSELIRVKLADDSGVYPTLSGNKYRYALRFMDASGSVDRSIKFQLASCR